MIWWILVLGAAIFLGLGHAIVTGNIARAAQQAGFSGADLVTAVAISYAESGGNPNAVGDQGLAPENGPSIGLWQINIGSRANAEYANANLTDPQTNANVAFRIYQQAGNSFRPWATFDPRDGSTPRYLAFLERAEQEVST